MASLAADLGASLLDSRDYKSTNVSTVFNFPSQMTTVVEVRQR